MKLPEIIGLSGLNGAGKDVLGLLLQERSGYHFISVSDLLRAELDRRGKEHNRENMSGLSREWRQESGDEGVMFTKGIEEYLAKKALEGWKGLVIGSIRHPAEAMRVKEHGGVVVWVQGDERQIYDRLQAVKRGRNEDQITFEQFQADIHREMYPPADAPAGTLNMGAVKASADFIIENNFPSVEAYREFLIKEFEL